MNNGHCLKLYNPYRWILNMQLREEHYKTLIDHALDIKDHEWAMDLSKRLKGAV